MDKETKGSEGGLPSNGILWLLLFVAGAFLVYELPWQGSRPPAGEPKAYRYVVEQDIDARLWQDPLGAITRGREEAKKRSGE